MIRYPEIVVVRVTWPISEFYIHRNAESYRDSRFRTLANQEVDGIERHGDGANEEIADCEWSDEIVCRLSNVALDDEGQDHNQVAAHREETGDGGQ